MSTSIFIRNGKFQQLGKKLQAIFADFNLNWRRWLVLFAMGAMVIAIEVRNHYHMWQEHNSGQTILTDHELIWEILIFGFVLPAVAGLTLRYLEQTKNERDYIVRELELRRDLVHQLNRTQNWDELIDHIVSTPGTLVAANHSWLLAQRAGTEELMQIAYWERPGAETPDEVDEVKPIVCAQCAEVSLFEGTGLRRCHHSNSTSTLSHGGRYCLRLTSEDARKAVLLFDMPADRSPTNDQTKMLNEVAIQMSLAIDNANLQYLEKRQIDAARNERMRIARDLHDTLGQNVSYLRLKLEQLSSSRLAADGAEFRETLDNMLIVADEAYEQVRDTLNELRMAEQIGVEESIQQFASRAGSRAGFSTHVQSTGQARDLSPRQTRHILYILREILNNVEKHAESQVVHIDLQWLDNELSMIVRDNGKGFITGGLRREDAYGLVIMEERARAISADLKIDSFPGSGTEIALTVPLPPVSPGVPVRQ